MQETISSFCFRDDVPAARRRLRFASRTISLVAHQSLGVTRDPPGDELRASQNFAFLSDRKQNPQVVPPPLIRH
jgi:hypothetical protein